MNPTGTPVMGVTTPSPTTMVGFDTLSLLNQRGVVALSQLGLQFSAVNENVPLFNPKHIHYAFLYPYLDASIVKRLKSARPHFPTSYSNMVNVGHTRFASLYAACLQDAGHATPAPLDIPGMVYSSLDTPALGHTLASLVAHHMQSINPADGVAIRPAPSLGPDATWHSLADWVKSFPTQFPNRPPPARTLAWL